MAHFHLSTDNSRGKLVNVSEPSSVSINGWHSGVNVEARKTEYGDKFYLWMSSGSDTQSNIKTLLGVITESKNGPVFTPAVNGVER